jgi:hypothetical protein
VSGDAVTEQNAGQESASAPLQKIGENLFPISCQPLSMLLSVFANLFPISIQIYVCPFQDYFGTGRPPD